MRQVKTARGKILDMGALAKQHEAMRAVSNVPMNARGDRLDNKGGVKATIQKVAKAAQDAKEEPQTVPLSEPKPVAREPEPVTTEPEVTDNMVVSSEIKEREDGSRYEEVEYADGSMETREIDE